LFNYFDQNGNRFSVVPMIHAVCLLTKRFDRRVEFDFVLLTLFILLVSWLACYK